jgi:hypothetical protein
MTKSLRDLKSFGRTKELAPGVVSSLALARLRVSFSAKYPGWLVEFWVGESPVFVVVETFDFLFLSNPQAPRCLDPPKDDH